MFNQFIFLYVIVFSSYEVISGHHHRVTLNGIDTGPSLPEHTNKDLVSQLMLTFDVWCLKFLLKWNVGKYLRATHHLYFQTSFLRRTVGKNVFAGVPCKKIALTKFRGAYLFQNPWQKSRDYILIRRCCPLWLHWIMVGSWFGRKNSKWQMIMFHSCEQYRAYEIREFS